MVKNLRVISVKFMNVLEDEKFWRVQQVTWLVLNKRGYKTSVKNGNYFMFMLVRTGTTQTGARFRIIIQQAKF